MTKQAAPGKRLRKKHRKSLGGLSMKGFARFLAQDQNEDEKSKSLAREWLKGKGIRS